MKAWWVIVLLYQLYSFIIALQPYDHPSAATDADWEIMAIDDMKFHNGIFYLKAKWEDNSKKFRSHYQTAPLDSIYEDCKIMKENSNKEDVQENLVVKFVDCLADPEPTEVVEYVSFVKAIAKLAKAKPSALFPRFHGSRNTTSSHLYLMLLTPFRSQLLAASSTTRMSVISWKKHTSFTSRKTRNTTAKCAVPTTVKLI